MILETVFTALLPAIIDGVKTVITRVSGGKKTLDSTITPTDTIALMDADTRKLTALASLDVISDAPRWVNAVRGLQRPVVALLVLLTWVITQFSDLQPENYEAVSMMTQSVIFYLFGDRTYNYLKK